MKKICLLLAISFITVQLSAQKTKSKIPVPPPPSSEIITDMVPPPPPPPPPPVPPIIVNDNEYDLSVHYNNGNNMVYMKKAGITEKISIDKWNANKAFYENKYGELPPPPPPAPPLPPAPPKPPIPPAQ